jgi:hypothetical protein
MGGDALAAHTRPMRRRETPPACTAQKSTCLPRRRDDSGGLALIHVTSAVTAFTVLAITLWAVAEQLWVAGVAFSAILTSIAVSTGVLAVIFTDSDDR